MKTTRTILTIFSLSLSVMNMTAQAPFAGNGTYGYSGDGGPATSAQLASVSGISGDATGNIYISDAGNSDVRMVNTSNIISTYAGNQISGFSGDGGAATSASMQSNTHIALDAAGNLYITDNAGARIRKVSASTGVINTIAGTGIAGNTGNGGAAILAQIQVGSIAVDAAGNIYFADFINSVIRKINVAGTISLYAGNGTAGYSGDGGPATSAQIRVQWSSMGNLLALDATGNLYISDVGNNVIRKVNTAGVISTYAGNGTNAHSGDGGAATAASIKNIGPIAINPAGELFLSAQSATGMLTLRRIDGSGKINTDRDSAWFAAIGGAFGNSFNMFYIDVKNTLYFDIWGLCGIGSAPGTVYGLVLDSTKTPSIVTIINREETPSLSIISPNGDGKDDVTLLSLGGNKIEIFNREGVLVKTLEGAKLWDGKDHSGSIVPMGYYIAICKDINTSAQISVIK